MSDYFGSLLRASGIDRSGTTRAPAPAADSAPSVAPPSATDSLEIESTMDRSLASTSLSTRQTERTVRESPQPQNTTASRMRRDAERASQSAKTVAAEAPAVLDQPATPLSQSLLQSTLRWIADDPQAPHRQAGSIATELSEPEQHIQAAARPSLAIEAAALTKREQPRRTEAATSVLDHASPAPAARLNDADDSSSFDVSIGSIHVRVDAPAPQTVAHALPTTSNTRAASLPSRQRSSLARRALRRL